MGPCPSADSVVDTGTRVSVFVRIGQPDGAGVKWMKSDSPVRKGTQQTYTP